MMEWGHKNILHDTPHIVLSDKESGEVLRSAFVTACGKVVDQKTSRYQCVTVNSERSFDRKLASSGCLFMTSPDSATAPGPKEAAA
jgi:hypothetical protein